MLASIQHGIVLVRLYWSAQYRIAVVHNTTLAKFSSLDLIIIKFSITVSINIAGKQN